MNTSSIICLPPGVPGAAKGQLVLQVVGLQWTHSVRKPPQLPYLIVRWWGDPGLGVSLPCVPGESVDFPVVAGPKRFARYLRDCQTLPVAVVEFTSNTTLGIANVDVRFLDVHAPIHNGSFPLISLEGVHLASLALSLEVEYNTTGGAVTSFELAEHQAGLGLNLPAQRGPNTATTVRTMPGAPAPVTATTARILPPASSSTLQTTTAAVQPTDSLTTATLAAGVTVSGTANQQGPESQVSGPSAEQAAVQAALPKASAAIEGAKPAAQLDAALATAAQPVPTADYSILHGPVSQQAVLSYHSQGGAAVLASGQPQPTAELQARQHLPQSSGVLAQDIGELALQAPLQQLDVSEALQSVLSRRFDEFYTIFKVWEEGDEAQHTIQGLLQLLQDTRLFPYAVTPDQLLYLTTVMDPAGDMQLELDTIMQAVRESQEAGLRVRTGQLGPVLPLLRPLVQQLQRQDHQLMALFQQPQAKGMPGALKLQDLISWLNGQRNHTSDTSRQASRYLMVMLLHANLERPLDMVTYQDLQAVLQTVQDIAKATPDARGMQQYTAAPMSLSADQLLPAAKQAGSSTAHNTRLSASAVDDPDGHVTDSAAHTPSAALQRLKRRALRTVRPSVPAASQPSPPRSPAVQGPAMAHELSTSAMRKVPSAPDVGAAAATDRSPATQLLPAAQGADVLNATAVTAQAGQQTAMMAPKPAPTAGLLRHTAQFLDLPRNISSATLQQTGPVRVIVHGTAPLQQKSTSEGPSTARDGVAGTQEVGADHDDNVGRMQDGQVIGGRDGKAASMDAEELQRVLKDAYGLRDQLNRAIASGQPRSAGSSPARKRLAGSNLTAQTLAAILHSQGEGQGSSETAGLLLDLLSSSPADRPTPIDVVRVRQPGTASGGRRAYEWALGGNGQDVARGSPASPMHQLDMRPDAATGYSSPTGSQPGRSVSPGHLRVHSPGRGSDSRYDSARYHDAHDASDQGSITDDEGAAQFTEQQLLRHLFFERVNPAAVGAPHASPSAGLPSQSTPLRASGQVHQQPSLLAHQVATPEQLGDANLSSPSGPHGGDETDMGMGVQLTVTSLALNAPPSTHAATAAPPTTAAGVAGSVRDDLQLVLKVRASCSNTHRLCVVKRPATSKLAVTTESVQHVQVLGGPVWLPVTAPQDALTAPPAQMVLELWQVPLSVSATNSTPHANMPDKHVPEQHMNGRRSPAPVRQAHVGSQQAASDLHQQFEAQLRECTAQLLGVAQAPLELILTPSSLRLGSSAVRAGAQQPATGAETADQQGPSSDSVQETTGTMLEEGQSQIMAAVKGVFPLVDVLGSMAQDSPTHSNTHSPRMHLGSVGSIGVHAELLGCVPLVRHTWRVTVCGAAGLPSEAVLEAAGLPVPSARYIKYLYPGESSALVTEEVPPSDAPIFAATALHSMVLPADTAPSVELLVGPDSMDSNLNSTTAAAPAEPLLLFEVWDKWASGPDTCVASARLPLSHLTSLPPGPHTSLLLPLLVQSTTPESIILTSTPSQGADALIPVVRDGSSEVRDRAADAEKLTTPAAATQHAPPSVSLPASTSMPMPATGPCVEIRLQAECVVVGPGRPSHTPTSSGHAHPAYHTPRTGSPTAGYTNAAGGNHIASPAGIIRQPVLPQPMTATLSVRIVAACGLQAAVQEAAAWLGGASAVLGKALQLGPHAFVTLQLFPANQALARRLPEIRTPFQAQAFCPRYDYHTQVELQLDTPTLRALLGQQACVEVYHHPSRALAALAAAQQAAPAGKVTPHTSGQGDAAGFGAPPATRQVLLGSGSISLAAVLLRPQGIQSWVLLRSARGQPVGGVQLAMQVTQLAGRSLDTCLSAPAPLDQVPAGQLQAVMPSDVPYPAIDLQLFQDQWARCTLHIEHVTLHPPPVQSAAAAAARAGSKQYKYYITYTLPGSDAEVTTTARAASLNKDGSNKPGPANNNSSASSSWSSAPSTQHVALQHVAVHWVRADARLAGALTRAPLRLTLTRAHERAATTTPSQSGNTGTGSVAAGASVPAATTPTWLSTQMMGSVDVDMSQLVVRAGQGSKAQAAARWVSGTYSLIDPAAVCFTQMHVRVKVLLELSPPSTPSGAVLAAGTWQPTEVYSSGSSTVEEDTLQLIHEHHQHQQQPGQSAGQTPEHRGRALVGAVGRGTPMEADGDAGSTGVDLQSGSRPTSPGTNASSPHAAFITSAAASSGPAGANAVMPSPAASRGALHLTGSPIPGEATPAAAGVFNPSDMFDLTRSQAPASGHHAAVAALSPSGDLSQRQAAVAVHPILGVSQGPADQPQSNSPHASAGMMPTGANPVQTGESPAQAASAATLEGGDSDPRDSLRQQLQDLDVLRLQWFNRLQASDAAEAGGYGAIIACPDPSAHSTPRGGVQAAQRQVAPELGQMASELEEMVSRLGQRRQQAASSQTPAASKVVEGSTTEELGYDREHQQAQQQGPSTLQSGMEEHFNGITAHPMTAAAGMPGSSGMPAMGDSSSTATYTRPGSSGMPGSSSTDHTGSASAATRVWVSTVRTSAASQPQASLIAVETCSDDGGGDMVLGGYSASEADTDELLASIPIAHEQHLGAHGEYGSDDEDPMRPTVMQSRKVMDQQQGKVGGNSRSRDRSSAAGSSKVGSTAVINGLGSASGIAPGAAADVREDVEWMFMFGRNAQPTAALAAACAAPQHPGLRSPQQAGMHAASPTYPVLSQAHLAAAGSAGLANHGQAPVSSAMSVPSHVTARPPVHPCDPAPPSNTQSAYQHVEVKRTASMADDSQAHGGHVGSLHQPAAAVSLTPQAASHHGLGDDDDMFSVRKSHVSSAQHVSAIQAIQHPGFGPPAAPPATSSMTSPVTDVTAQSLSTSTPAQHASSNQAAQQRAARTAATEVDDGAMQEGTAQQPYAAGAVSRLQARLDALLAGFQQQVSGVRRFADDEGDEDDPLTLNANMGIQAVRVSYGPAAGTHASSHQHEQLQGATSSQYGGYAGQQDYLADEFRSASIDGISRCMGSHVHQGTAHAGQMGASRHTLEARLAEDMAPSEGSRFRFANALPPVQPDFQLRFTD